jgi:STE24 endopeptidase
MELWLKRIVAGFSCLLIVVAITSYIPYPAAVQSARNAGFSEEVIAIGLQRSAQSRFVFWCGQFITGALFVWYGFSATPRNAVDALRAKGFGVIVIAAVMAGALKVACDVLLLPLNILGYWLGQKWEMLNPDYTLAKWGLDYLLASTVELLLLLLVVAVLYCLLSWLPRWWWLLTPVVGGVIAVIYALLAPLIIDPLFNTFLPISETEWKDIRPRIIALTQRAGLPVQEIYVMNASRTGKHSNAYFAGFGSTRRIVFYDNLLRNQSIEEVESILAHEIGHWKNDHIFRGIALGSLALLLGAWIVDGLLVGAIKRTPWHLAAKNDPASIGLLAMVLFFGDWLVRPVENYVSRSFEVQADLASLDLIKNREVFVRSEQRLAIQNKSNVAPSPWNQWIFSTHPSSVERIRMAREFEQ